MEVADFGFSKIIEMVMECLIALGHPFQCEMDDCVFENPEFSLSEKSQWPSIDHITPTLAGGSNKPDNLRFAHRRCNFGAPTRSKIMPERSLRRHSAKTRQKISDSSRAYWVTDAGKAHQERRQLAAERSRKLRECECGIISFPPSMGSHLKASGHKLKETA